MKQFDRIEATIAHLFRHPHPALQNLSYGAAFCHQLLARGLLTEVHTAIVEVGGGLGHFAHAFLTHLQQTGRRLPYFILDLSPQLQQAERCLLADLPAEFILGDSQQLPFCTDKLRGLIVCNELIADFDAIELIRFVQEIARVLASGGCAVLTGHGFEGNVRLTRTGRLDDEDGSHLEYSIDFDHLRTVARAAGLVAEVVPLIDFLSFDREAEVANLNDARALNAVDPIWPVAAIPATEIYKKYGCDVRLLAGLRLPKIGGEGFPDDNALPFAQSFQALILRKL